MVKAFVVLIHFNILSGQSVDVSEFESMAKCEAVMAYVQKANQNIQTTRSTHFECVELSYKEE